MKVGIYNRHLTGVGGGEKHMLVMAEVLSRQYPVDVLTHHVLDLGSVGTKLGIDLSRVRLRSLPDGPDPALAPLTSEYDVFINASDGTFVPSQASRSILLVYFPTPVRNTVWTRFKWYAGHWLRRTLMVPRYVAGFYGPEKFGAMTVRWTTQRAQLEIPVPGCLRSLELRLVLISDRAIGPVTFSVDEQQVSACTVPAERVTSLTVSLPAPRRGPLRLDIDVPGSDDGSRGDCQRGVAVADVEVRALRYRLYQWMFQQWFRELGQRLDALYPTLTLDHLDTYDTICANSSYTKQWIEHYWHRNAVVFYPPVDVDLFEPLPKRQQILSVGRFFTTGHNKKHLVMIRSFREMLDRGLGGWELHLAGGTSLGKMNTRYVSQVRSAAAGLPIHIHTDVSLEALRRLYGESAIYWHATGYGENPERYPLRYEHFGLTTVEAMAAGAVPVVINGGGQPEIITHGVDGFLWDSTDQLKALTGRLIEHPELRRQMGAAARRRSHAFSRTSFETRLWEIMGC